MSSPFATNRSSLRRNGDGDVDWRTVLTTQKNTGSAAASCTGGIEYLRRTTTPRRGRNPDPLSAQIEQWDSPRDALLSMTRDRPITAPAARNQDAVARPSLANHLSATELDFHLSRVTELLRRAPEPNALPEDCKRKIRQVAAYEAFLKEEQQRE